MTASNLKFALIGYGAIAEKHLEVFRALGVKINSACNRSAEKRLAAQEKGKIERTYKTISSLIKAEKPDGILVTVSFTNMFEVVSELIPYGIPLLIEKPPALSLADTRLLDKLAEKQSVPVMVGLNRRFYSVYHQALEKMGGKGKLTNISVEWSEDPFTMLKKGKSIEEIKKFVYANSLHGIDLLTFFGGVIASPEIWGRNLDLTGKTLRWQMSVNGTSVSGARVSFSSNWDVPGRWRLVVDAPDTRLISAPLETGNLLIRGKGSENILPSSEDENYKPGFYAQASYFKSVVMQEKSIQWPACSLSEACESIALAELMTSRCLER